MNPCLCLNYHWLLLLSKVNTKVNERNLLEIEKSEKLLLTIKLVIRSLNVFNIVKTLKSDDPSVIYAHQLVSLICFF